MQGFIALYRCLLDKPIWKNSTPEQKSILITLLLMVNHESKEWEWKGEKFRAEPGQTITSLEKIAEECGKGVSVQNVRTALTRFEKLEFLTNESTKTGRLITIMNWGLYQLDYKKPNKEPNNDLTKSQQRPNKDLTPNNNDNNDNNENKNIIGEFTANEDLKLAIKDFITMRKQIKKPMTARAVKLMLGKLTEVASNDDDRIKVLNNSIANCWQDIYPLKQDQQSNVVNMPKKRSDIKFKEG